MDEKEIHEVPAELIEIFEILEWKKQTGSLHLDETYSETNRSSPREE